jgi:hypothetical protein
MSESARAVARRNSVTKLRLAGLVLTVLATGLPVAAHADGPGYIGTCRITTLNDTTPGGTFGGLRVWNGEVDIAVAATTPGALVSAGCYIKVTAPGTESKILDATVVGGQVGVGAGRATFTADVTDTVYICTHVTTTSNGAQDQCAALTTTPVCPAQLCGDGGIVDQLGLLGEGTTVYSTACDGGLQVVDSVVEGVHVKLYVAQPTPQETDVCVRADDATTGEGAGGEFVITPTAPVVLGIPSTDTSSALCTTTKPNAVPGAHPIASTGVLGNQVVLDAYAGTAAAWVCLSAGSTVNVRVIVPVPALAPGSVVTFHPDPGSVPTSVLSTYVNH